VVTWNRTLLGAVAGDPLDDPRSHVFVGDVADLIRQEQAGFDAILMDVDNGPEALVRRENNWLYSSAGLRATRAALRPRGVLAVWSASADRPFSKRLRQAGFDVCEHTVRPHRAGKGPRHHIWIQCVRIVLARDHAIIFGSGASGPSRGRSMPQLVLACLALLLTAAAARTEQPLDIVIYGARHRHLRRKRRSWLARCARGAGSRSPGHGRVAET